MAAYNIKADRMSGELRHNNLKFFNVFLDSPKWLVHADIAKKPDKCIFLTNNVSITNKESNYKIIGQSFKYCDKDQTLYALKPIKIVKDNVASRATNARINMKTGFINLSGVSSTYAK